MPLPTDEQRHLHVQAHLNATPLDTFPASASELLHRYEDQNAPAPMQTYTSVITFLLSRPCTRTSLGHLFSHPILCTSKSSTVMIRACVSPVNPRYSSEPEKALDLCTEMTQDQKIFPTVGSYNAIILACAKSGTKSFVK